MKNHYIAMAVALSGIAITSNALGRGAALPDDSLYVIPNLSIVSVGAAWEQMEREMESGDMSWISEARSAYGFVGIDITPWATIRGGVGQSEFRDPNGEYGDSDTMWLTGLDCSLWRHEVTAPSYAACTLDFLVSYTYYDHTTDASDWTENRVSALISAEFVAQHAFPDADNVPYSAVFSVGPVGSFIDGNGDMIADYEEKDSVGVAFGADLKLNRKLSLGWEGRVFGGDWSHSVIGAFHF